MLEPYDPADLIHPHIDDWDTLAEFYYSLNDKVPSIEGDVARLRRQPHDLHLVADLFRALHNIKGDAAICKVNFGVLLAHPVETLLSRLRSGEVPFSDLLADLILLALDRLEMATETVFNRHGIDQLHLPALVDGFNALNSLPADQVETAAASLIEGITGFRPGLASAQVKPAPVHAKAAPGRKEHVPDLDFFRHLALQLEARSPHFKGRGGRLLRLALETNKMAGDPVDPVQLEAAVHLHDLGMMFLPESVWLKADRLSETDRKALAEHPSLGAGLLARMPGWSEAARIVLEHHEMPDGGGYPRALKGDAICPGAKILAIADAFEAVTLKHSHRGERRSLLRAVAEVNACDKQFDPFWIGHFNEVIRRMG
ncbi:hypothetical protein DLREEDagrD3_20660 [Denitratisoma sp. agr-D3]